MNFKQLEYFVAVAEAKSISKAARKLHVAQPPISRQIAMLEDELKVCLFLRTNKGVELTEAGRWADRNDQVDAATVEWMRALGFEVGQPRESGPQL